jgi:two-component system, NarL family, sensor histidine kinase YdfH
MAFRTLSFRTMAEKSSGCIIITMEQPTSSSRLLTRMQKEIRSSFSNMQPVWPFFITLTVAMIILYGLTLESNLVMRQPVNLVIFTLLMVVHTGLHWLSPLAGISGKRSAIYLLAQMTLVMSLIALVQYEPLFYTLFLGLIGELLGVVKPLRRSLVAIFCLTGIMFITHGLFFRWETTLSFIITIGPLTFFIVIYVYLFTRQLEERGRAEKLLKELETAHQQLSEYAIRIEELTLTNERQRMARELHDTLSQGLAGVILQLEAAGQHLEEGHTEKASAIVKQASSRARSTLAEARQVIDDLRNATPAGVDLQDFIQAEADHFTSLTGLPCEVRIEKNTTISDQLTLQIEKIISEGLTNIERHAHANHSWIHLASNADKIRLEIGDDGLGFDVDAYQFESGHYGLVGIRERVRLAEGVLKVESHPGKGTLLTITFSNARSGEKKP